MVPCGLQFPLPTEQYLAGYKAKFHTIRLLLALNYKLLPLTLHHNGNALIYWHAGLDAPPGVRRRCCSYCSSISL